MKEDLEDFFAGNGEGENTEIETQETETVEAEATTEEVENVEAEVEAEVETEAEAKPEQKPQGDNYVPLAALLEEREKAKAKQASLDELQSKYDAIQQQRTQSNIPDPYDDPQGYHAYLSQTVEQQVAMRMEQEKLLQVRAQAVAEHGEDVVAELADWVDDYAEKVDPLVGQKAFESGDPISYAMNLKKRHETLKALESDEEAFIRERAKALGMVGTPVEAAPTNQSPKKPSAGPKSIATAANRESNKGGYTNFFDAIDNN